MRYEGQRASSDWERIDAPMLVTLDVDRLPPWERKPPQAECCGAVTDLQTDIIEQRIERRTERRRRLAQFA
jgi:hypothetical protein